MLSLFIAVAAVAVCTVLGLVVAALGGFVLGLIHHHFIAFGGLVGCLVGLGLAFLILVGSASSASWGDILTEIGRKAFG